ncbi:MAG: hypothetical protein K6G88_12165 [Lachnospiraceae bacterium]|nr:hypothetical protein [Lachnospiraceae bacterium]
MGLKKCTLSMKKANGYEKSTTSVKKANGYEKSTTSVKTANGYEKSTTSVKTANGYENQLNGNGRGEKNKLAKIGMENEELCKESMKAL